jgi:hypothetical protein
MFFLAFLLKYFLFYCFLSFVICFFVIRFRISFWNPFSLFVLVRKIKNKIKKFFFPSNFPTEKKIISRFEFNILTINPIENNYFLRKLSKKNFLTCFIIQNFFFFPKHQILFVICMFSDFIRKKSAWLMNTVMNTVEFYFGVVTSWISTPFGGRKVQKQIEPHKDLLEDRSKIFGNSNLHSNSTEFASSNIPSLASNFRKFLTHLLFKLFFSWQYLSFFSIMGILFFLF